MSLTKSTARDAGSPPETISMRAPVISDARSGQTRLVERHDHAARRADAVDVCVVFRRELHVQRFQVVVQLLQRARSDDRAGDVRLPPASSRSRAGSRCSPSPRRAAPAPRPPGRHVRCRAAPALAGAYRPGNALRAAPLAAGTYPTGRLDHLPRGERARADVATLPERTRSSSTARRNASPIDSPSGFWLLASGFWLLASGFWLLVAARGLHSGARRAPAICS